MVGAHQAEIELVEFVARPFDILHRADTGGRPVDRHAVGDCLFEHGPCGPNARHAVRVGAD